MMAAKIVIATIGQPSTNPRMLKEVDVLIKEGYEVKVLYGYWASWGVKADQPILDHYPGVFEMVGGDPVHRKGMYFFSRIIYKAARLLGRFIPICREYAINRPCFFLQRRVAREKADLYIGHNLGTLPAVVKAARKWNARCGFDAEDFHRGQYYRPEGEDYRNTIYVEDRYMPACDYLTAASPLIAAVYKELLGGKEVAVVNNVFSIAGLQPLRTTGGRPLRLFWFSQSLGPDRGLEVIVEALNLLSGYDITLDLIGDCPQAYKQQLLTLAKKPDALHFLPPVGPDELFGIAGRYDIGFAAEVPLQKNRDICLTNKIFTYLLAGNCILASDTQAQQQFMEANPGVGMLYRYNDPGDLAGRIAVCYNEPAVLHACMAASHAAAAGRYNWESEKRIFLEQVKKVL